MPDVNELPTRMLQDVERYVGYVACIMLLTSWAIRQLNSGHEATLIPIKKQNLTQGVRKNMLFQQFVVACILAQGFSLKMQNGRAKKHFLQRSIKGV